MSEENESLFDKIAESSTEEQPEEDVRSILRDPLFLLIVKIGACVVAWVCGYVIAVALTSDHWLSLMFGLVLPIGLAWPLFAPRHRRPIYSRSTRRLGRKHINDAMPPFIQASELAYRYSRLSDQELDDGTMYDSQRHWIVTVMMFFRPRVIHDIDHVIVDESGRSKPAPLRIWKAVLYHLIFLAILVVVGLLVIPTNRTNGYILLMILVYVCWASYIIWLSARNRFIVTTRSIAKFERQLPWRAQEEIVIPAAQLNQFPERRTLWAKLFGWADFNILTKEQDEQLKWIRFIRDSNRLGYALRWLEEKHAPDMRDVSPSDELPSPELTSPPQPTSGTRHTVRRVHRANPGGRPPR